MKKKKRKEEKYTKELNCRKKKKEK